MTASVEDPTMFLEGVSDGRRRGREKSCYGRPGRERSLSLPGGVFKPNEGNMEALFIVVVALEMVVEEERKRLPAYVSEEIPSPNPAVTRNKSGKT